MDEKTSLRVFINLYHIWIMKRLLTYYTVYILYSFKETFVINRVIRNHQSRRRFFRQYSCVYNIHIYVRTVHACACVCLCNIWTKYIYTFIIVIL